MRASRATAALVFGVDDEHADGAKADAITGDDLLDGAEAQVADQLPTPRGNDDPCAAVEQLK